MTSETPTSGPPPDSEAAALASGVARLESLPNAEVTREKADSAPAVPSEPEPTEGTPPPSASAVGDADSVSGNTEEDSGWRLPFNTSDILGD